MIRKLMLYFKKLPAAPVTQAPPGKRAKFCAITQNRLLGAHVAHAGRFTRGQKS